MGFLRQAYCSGLPFPAAGNLPDPRTELRSPALQADSLPAEPPGKPIFHMVVCVWKSQSPSSSHSPGILPHDHISITYIWVSIPALQVGSSVPFFYLPHICINTQYLFFSFWLTLLCMTEPRSIHISTNNPILFVFNFHYNLFLCTGISVCLLTPGIVSTLSHNTPLPTSPGIFTLWGHKWALFLGWGVTADLGAKGSDMSENKI